MAKVAATIRNNGHVNPDAVYYGRGPFTPDDILASRMVADPFHILECSMTSEGGCAHRAHDRGAGAGLPAKPVCDPGRRQRDFGPAYVYPPVWDLAGRAGIPATG